MNTKNILSVVLAGALSVSLMFPATQAFAASDVENILGTIASIEKIFGGGKKSGNSGGNSGNINAASLSNQKHARPNPTHNEKLFMLAVEKHDMGTVKEMLATGVDINGVYGITNKGITPFYRALLNGDRDMMQFLLENGADVNGYYDYDNQYICYLVEAADQYTDIGILEYLHNWGADINGKDKYGNNALNVALGRVQPLIGNPSAAFHKAKYLLSQGINPDNIFSGPYRHDHYHQLDDRPPFLGACAMGWISMADLLAQNGANINAKDQSGRSALDIALATNDLQVYKAVQDILARGQQPSIYREKAKTQAKGSKKVL